MFNKTSNKKPCFWFFPKKFFVSRQKRTANYRRTIDSYRTRFRVNRISVKHAACRQESSRKRKKKVNKQGAIRLASTAGAVAGCVCSKNILMFCFLKSIIYPSIRASENEFYRSSSIWKFFF